MASCPIFCPSLSNTCPCIRLNTRALLAEIADIAALLAGRLEKRGSGYASVMRAIEALACRPANREAVEARLAGDKPDDTAEALDKVWEEAPVSFTEPAAGGTECPKAAAIVAQFEEGVAGGRNGGRRKA